MNPIAMQRLIDVMADGQAHAFKTLNLLTGLSESQCREYLDEVGLAWRITPTHGLQLSRSLQLLNLAAIKTTYQAASIRGDAILSLAVLTSSTNADLLSMSSEAGEAAQIRFAEYQTAGRGRRDRGWIMPYASGIAMSLRRGFALPMAELAGLSLVAGVAVARWLNEILGVDVGLKWPNDIVHEQTGKLYKLGGILVEAVTRIGGGCNVVTGIGLNYRLGAEQSPRIDQPMAQLAELLAPRECSRSELAGQLAAAVETAYCEFATGGFPAFRRQWQDFDILQGRELQVSAEGHEYVGRCAGIDLQGGLLIDTPTGQRTLTSAQASVRLV